MAAARDDFPCMPMISARHIWRHDADTADTHAYTGLASLDASAQSRAAAVWRDVEA